MISTKKVYAEQILKLVLALSLLRTDPENYLEWGLENRLASTVGGWQLELRAAPLTDYPYANRKAVMPLIEDLARYQDYSNSNSHIQAYLFTHSSHIPSGLIPENNSSENQTSVTISESARNNNNASTPQATVDPSTLQLGEVNPEELFLNADVFQEAASILEQNLADLNEYGEAAAATQFYQNLKEPNDVNDASFFDIFKCERPGSDCADFGSFTAPAPDDDEGDNLGGVIEWDEYLGKKEAIDESAVAVKKQAEKHEEQEKGTSSSNQTDTSSVRIHDPVTAELTEEEMDLIKILATQDIDMGFIPPLTEAEQSQKEKDEKENAEKLKVLLHINDEKNEKYTKDDEPEGDLGDIQYTIDLETGEKILLNISSSAESQDPLVDPVFEDASSFAEKIENTDLDLSNEVVEEEVATSNNNVVSEELINSAELVADDDLATEFDLDALDALLDEKLEEELEDDDNFSIDLPDLDETDFDMYIQSSGYQHHHHHARQGMQNYGHGIGRQPPTAGYLPHHQLKEWNKLSHLLFKSNTIHFVFLTINFIF
uniref:CSON011931 protein n=1 Tax=Culicoides sonorensis TaxID=179676 RepID=A0A336M486_CULSO